MESIFEIIAEPNRRAILSLLSRHNSRGEIERQLGMPQPMVSKHCACWREAVSMESMVDASAVFTG